MQMILEGKKIMNNRTLLVTGASSDIGCALIRKTAANYKTIYAHYNGAAEKITELSRETGGKVIPLQADFSDEASVEGMISEIRATGVTPDHIVHLVSPRLSMKKFKKLTVVDFEEEIRVSVLSAVNILIDMVPEMAKRKYGKVVFMLSANTVGNPPAFQSVYVTQKYALLGLMKSLAAEYAQYGVTVNAVSPDMMETGFLSEVPQTAVKMSAEGSPLGRNLTVDDVVPSFIYLLSDGADTVTGVNLPVSVRM